MSAVYIPIIGFPRFRDYVRPFKEIAVAHPGEVGIDNVLRLYRFDRKLRLITLDAIERIELSFKQKVSDALERSLGEKWFTKRSVLNSYAQNLHSNIMNDVKRTSIWKSMEQEEREYSTFPVDRVLDAQSLGRVVILFNNLSPNEKTDISRAYGTTTVVFETWIKAVRDIRNASAHHSRLWNSSYRVKIKIPHKINGFIGEVEQGYEQKFYGYAIVLNLMLRSAARNSQWRYRLRKLIEEHNIEHLDVKKVMGFPYDWWENPVWKPEDGVKISELLSSPKKKKREKTPK